jgi:hypothetical protein
MCLLLFFRHSAEGCEISAGDLFCFVLDLSPCGRKGGGDASFLRLLEVRSCKGTITPLSLLPHLSFFFLCVLCGASAPLLSLPSLCVCLCASLFPSPSQADSFALFELFLFFFLLVGASSFVK